MCRITSAATLAAGVFLAVHLLWLKSTFPEDQIVTRRQVIQVAADSVRALDLNVRGLSSRGAHLLEMLLVEESLCIASEHIGKEALVTILEEAESGKTPTYAADAMADFDLYTNSGVQFVDALSGDEASTSAGLFSLASDPFMGGLMADIPDAGDWINGLGTE